MWCLLWTTVGTVGRVSMVSTMGTVGRVSTVGTVGSALSVDDAGHHGGALRGGGGEDGAGVPVRALLLVAELVVVGAEPPATVAARVGLLPWTPALVRCQCQLRSAVLPSNVTCVDSHVSVPG